VPDLSTLSFAEPERLLLLLVVPVLAAGLVALALRGRQDRRAWSDPAVAGSSLPLRATWRRLVPALLLLLGIGTATVAYATPQVLAPEARERSILVVTLDVSTSMLAEDVAPNRITAAVRAAQDFVEALPPQVEVGLVVYNANVRLVSPPTADHALVARELEGLGLSGGTALGDAVTTGLTSLPADFKAGPSEGPPAARIVVLSDGGSTTGRPVDQAAEEARRAGVPVSTIAYGTPEGIVVQGDQTFPVPVDTVVLEQLAEATGGTAYLAASAGQLEQVYDDIGTRVSRETARRELTAPVSGLALVLLVGTAVAGMGLSGRVP
jgi:Ca-activated chloride channel family protein